MGRVATYNSKVLVHNSKVVSDTITSFTGVTSVKGWYAARLIPGLPDNTGISRVTDFSGNSTVLKQATSGDQPKFRTNIINSLPAWEFDGSDDHFSFTSLALTQNKAGLTTYVVYKRVSGSSAQALISFLNNGSVSRHSLIVNGGGSSTDIVAGARRVSETAATASFTNTDTQWHVVCNVTNYATDLVSLYFDGELKQASVIGGTSGTSSQNSPSGGVECVGSINDAGNYFNGYIAEIVFCDAAHSGTEVKNIMASLSRIYGVLPQ